MLHLSARKYFFSRAQFHLKRMFITQEKKSWEAFWIYIPANPVQTWWSRAKRCDLSPHICHFFLADTGKKSLRSTNTRTPKSDFIQQQYFEQFKTITIQYGNTGCGVFKRGVQNQKGFCLRINILKGNFSILRIGLTGWFRKLGIILESKVI